MKQKRMAMTMLKSIPEENESKHQHFVLASPIRTTVYIWWIYYGWFILLSPINWLWTTVALVDSSNDSFQLTTLAIINLHKFVQHKISTATAKWKQRQNNNSRIFKIPCKTKPSWDLSFSTKSVIYKMQSWIWFFFSGRTLHSFNKSPLLQHKHYVHTNSSSSRFFYCKKDH